jgi:hypothetical protein
MQKYVHAGIVSRIYARVAKAPNIGRVESLWSRYLLLVLFPGWKVSGLCGA